MVTIVNDPFSKIIVWLYIKLKIELNYLFISASTIVDECESMNRSKDDLDLPQHSTPLKRPGQVHVNIHF